MPLLWTIDSSDTEFSFIFFNKAHDKSRVITREVINGVIVCHRYVKFHIAINHHKKR